MSSMCGDQCSGQYSTQLAHAFREDLARIGIKGEQLQTRSERTGGHHLIHIYNSSNQWVFDSFHSLYSLHFASPRAFWPWCMTWVIMRPAFELPSFHREGTHLPSTIRAPQLPHCIQLSRFPQRYGKTDQSSRIQTHVLGWCGVVLAAPIQYPSTFLYYNPVLL